MGLRAGVQVSRFSDAARPPVTPEEAEEVERKMRHSICRIHDGLVSQTGDVEGRVFFCPIGKQFWRYTAKQVSGLYAPLHYPNSGAV